MKTKKHFSYNGGGSKVELAEIVGELLRESFREYYNANFFARFLLNLDLMNGWISGAEYVKRPEELEEWLERVRGRSISTITVKDLHDFTLFGDREWFLYRPDGVEKHFSDLARRAYSAEYVFYKRDKRTGPLFFSIESSHDEDFSAVLLFDDAFQEVSSVEVAGLTPYAEGSRVVPRLSDWSPDANYPSRRGLLSLDDRKSQLARAVLSRELLADQFRSYNSNQELLALSDFHLFLERGVEYLKESWQSAAFILPLFIR